METSKKAPLSKAAAQEKVNAVLAQSAESGIPILWCTLADDGIGLRGKCPHCNKMHSHGAAHDPGPYWGHRVPHCLDADNKGYFLVDITYQPPAQ